MMKVMYIEINTMCDTIKDEQRYNYIQWIRRNKISMSKNTIQYNAIIKKQISEHQQKIHYNQKNAIQPILNNRSKELPLIINNITTYIVNNSKMLQYYYVQFLLSVQ